MGIISETTQNLEFETYDFKIIETFFSLVLFCLATTG